jgi:hypothetical protein
MSLSIILPFSFSLSSLSHLHHTHLRPISTARTQEFPSRFRSSQTSSTDSHPSSAGSFLLPGTSAQHARPAVDHDSLFPSAPGLQPRTSPPHRATATPSLRIERPRAPRPESFREDTVFDFLRRASLKVKGPRAGTSAAAWPRAPTSPAVASAAPRPGGSFSPDDNGRLPRAPVLKVGAISPWADGSE